MRSREYWRHAPLFNVEDVMAMIPKGCVPVAVDLVDDAINIYDYTHPDRAFYIFGPEDGTLPKEVTEKCREKIYIPTTHCMNLAVTTQIVLYDRSLKRRESHNTIARADNRSFNPAMQTLVDFTG